MHRRDFLMASGASLLLPSLVRAQAKRKTTNFQIACMTLPYSALPAGAGADGHQGGRLHVRRLGHDAPGGRQERAGARGTDAAPEKAKELAKKCRDLGLEPVMMFSSIYPEANDGLEVLKNALAQAAAAEHRRRC